MSDAIRRLEQAIALAEGLVFEQVIRIAAVEANGELAEEGRENLRVFEGVLVEFFWA